MTAAECHARLTDQQIDALLQSERIALRDLLDRVIPLAAAIERSGGGATFP